MITLLNPTGKPIRVDSGGDGHFGARRSKTVDRRKVYYRHNGTDFSCKPGQKIYSPIAGKIIRMVYPYSNHEYEGLVISNEFMQIKLFYLSPDMNLIDIKQGGVIGRAQDISKLYREYGVTPHIHLEIESISVNPELYIKAI
ncbi:MAG: peptidoglycan DD-metalloendopeptidase family protein [Nanoarchaeota archaeon]|nr:peptidoglycan DD-metalloendopeptidase family protein [Nanoarchaeota archaeon]